MIQFMAETLARVQVSQHGSACDILEPSLRARSPTWNIALTRRLSRLTSSGPRIRPHQKGFDALVIGCFYDTALHDAREISGDMLVVAPCHASIEIALTLANNFSIIVGQRKWVNQMQNTVREYGYGEKLMSFRHVGMNVVEFQQDHECTRDTLIAAGRQAVEEDYAESLILGCTLETGFYQELEAELGVPVIDPSIAAFKAAEHAALAETDSAGGNPAANGAAKRLRLERTRRVRYFQPAV